MFGDSLLEAGEMLNLRYRIEKVLKEQEDTVTYLAFDSKRETYVIVKEFSPVDWGKDRRLFEMGKRDFMKMAGKIAINSGKRGMTSIIDWFLENGTAYEVEDFIQGIPLMSYVDMKMESGNFNMENIKFFMEDIFKALKAVHKTGICHGNISPDNIIVQENGEAKIVGFSLISQGVKKQALSYVGYEEGNIPVKNPGYAAPEQYSFEEDWGYSCDVYGLSAVFYFCITGQVPPESVLRLSGARLAKPGKRNGRLSENEEKAILKGMELDRRYRYPDLEIMYRALYEITPEQEEKNSLNDLERRLHAEQERGIFDDIDWHQESNISDIESNLKIGINREENRVRMEKRQEELKKNSKPAETSNPSKPVEQPKDKGKRLILVILLAVILTSGAVAALIVIMDSSLFSDNPLNGGVTEETATPEPTPGLTSEVYELKALNVYKVYRNNTTDYAVVVLSFTNNSKEAVSLNDIYDVTMQENGTDLKRADKFKSRKFNAGKEKKELEPGETMKIPMMFQLLDKEINRISVIFTAKNDSGVRVERRMKLSRKYYDLEVDSSGKNSDSAGEGGKPEEGKGDSEPEDEDTDDLMFPNVSASSYLADYTSPDGKKYTYRPENLIDGDLTTCWSEGKQGDGVYEYVILSSDKEQTVRGMNFYNGSEENEYWFSKNGRAHEIAIEFSDGTVIYKIVDSEFSKQPTTIDFGKDIKTKSIKIIIVSADTPEDGYQDTSISEIEVY